MTATPATKTNSSTRYVIEAMMLIAQSPDPLGLNEIAEAMDLPQSTAHRALMTLEESGFAKRSGRTAKLVAGELVHHLIRSMVGLFPARCLLAEQMRELSNELDVTVSLNWRVGWHSLRLSSFEGSRESYQIRRVGEARPLHSGIGPTTILAALGKKEISAYLDWWGSVRSVQSAVDAPIEADLLKLSRLIVQEGRVKREPTAYSALVWLSYPLRSDDGQVCGSLSVGLSPDALDDLDLQAQVDSRVADIGAQLLAAGEAARSPFDLIAPDDIQMDALNVVRLSTEAD